MEIIDFRLLYSGYKRRNEKWFEAAYGVPFVKQASKRTNKKKESGHHAMTKLVRIMLFGLVTIKSEARVRVFKFHSFVILFSFFYFACFYLQFDTDFLPLFWKYAILNIVNKMKRHGNVRCVVGVRECSYFMTNGKWETKSQKVSCI